MRFLRATFQLQAFRRCNLKNKHSFFAHMPILVNSSIYQVSKTKSPSTASAYLLHSIFLRAKRLHWPGAGTIHTNKHTIEQINRHEQTYERTTHEQTHEQTNTRKNIHTKKYTHERTYNQMNNLAGIFSQRS